MKGKYGSITTIETRKDGTKIVRRSYPTTPFALPEPIPAQSKNPKRPRKHKK
jgi:hypothetical protein